jgi:alkanesulfonate monooxygenase SsuD/methylene tetrahydromethanopterin reductase-like flavin-dependent oxidoreductase (luciferase family)
VCPNIDLITAAVILRRNDPLRIAERAVVADLLSKGWPRLGLGRSWRLLADFCIGTPTMDGA